MARSWLIGGGVLLVALLVASIALALREDEETLPEGTPEGELQRYLKAVEDEDYQAAYEYLAASLKATCSAQNFTRNLTQQDRQLRDSRVTLDRTQTTGDTALVTVTITDYRNDNPFDPTGYSFQETYSLRLEEGQWRFTWLPWPLYSCSRFSMGLIQKSINIQTIR